ncbi:MAG: coat protein F [Gracilibacter sp. BRH_c7a]|nr:MAG: coat protein F [Gracilibacter sp. BRH_c7a]
MGILETLFGVEDIGKLAKQDIVNDMMKDSKFALSSLILAISESSNPQMRQVLKKELNSALQKHFRLADIAVENDWYHPYWVPNKQVKEDYENAQSIIRE